MKINDGFLKFVMKENERLQNEVNHWRKHQYNGLPSVIVSDDEEAQYYDINDRCDVLQFEKRAIAGVEYDFSKMSYHFYTRSNFGPKSFAYNYWSTRDEIAYTHDLAALLTAMNEKVLHSFYKAILDEREKENENSISRKKLI
jgi:hypothetical protein